ncbi:MAG: 5'-methylthioadenosine/S-adenosylhomocysteine nucleosidase [Pseudomonadota bacterium]
MDAQLVKLGSLTALPVMANDAEYGDELKKRIKPLFCGVGPVEAGVLVSKALAELAASSSLPDIVLSLGSAGSNSLEQGAVYEVSQVSYRDMDASAFGFEKGQTPFLDVPPIVEIEKRIAGVPSASLSTGANVVSGDAYAAIDADMVDMESWAVMRTTQVFGIGFLGLRGISDGREPVSSISDWTDYLHVVDENLAAALDKTNE